MRRIPGKYQILLFSILSSYSLFSATPIQDSLVKNSSFESGFSPWTKWGSAGKVSSGQYSGSGACRVQANGGGCIQTISTKAVGSATYKLTAFSRTDRSSDKAYLGINFLDSSGKKIKEHVLANSSSSYALRTIEVQAPSNAVTIRVFGLMNGGSGAAYFDDFKLSNLSSAPAPDVTPTPEPDITPTPAPQPPPQSTSNVLQNGGFDDGLSPWSVWGGGQRTTSGQRSGSGACRITYSGGGCTQDMQLITGGVYRLKAYSKVYSSTDKAYIGIKFFDSQNNTIEEFNQENSSTSYTQKSLEVTVPEGAVSSRVFAYKESGPAHADFDDFELILVSAPVPLIENSGFDEGMSPWYTWSGGQRTTSGQRSGSGACRVTYSGGGCTQELSQDLSIGSSYRLSAFSKVYSSSDKAYIGIKFLDSSDSLISEFKVENSSTSYTQKTIDVTVPANTASTKVFAYKESGPAHADFDDFDLRPISGSPQGPTEVRAEKGLSVPADQLRWLSDSDLDAYINDMASLGSQWLRVDIYWRVVQANGRSSYDYSQFDRIVSRARAKGIKVLGILMGTPDWAKKSGTNVPNDPNDYARFARQTALHYASQGVSHYEIWNEPNLSNFFSTMDAALYTRLLKAAYTSIKEVLPSATVISAGLSPSPSTGSWHTSAVDFMKGIYSNGGKGYFDAVGFHPYSWPLAPSNTVTWNGWRIMYGNATSIRSIMVNNGDGNKKIWMTEYGSPSNDVGEETQSNHIAEAFSLARSYSWSGPLIIYSYKDRGTNPDDTEHFYGLVRYNNSKKPSYYLFRSIPKL